MIPEMLRVEEAFELVKELLKPDLGPMYVTPHDIDERVDFLSYTHIGGNPWGAVLQ